MKMLITIVLLLSTHATADTVYLVGGRSWNGTTITKDGVTFTTTDDDGQRGIYKREEILRIEFNDITENPKEWDCHWYWAWPCVDFLRAGEQDSHVHTRHAPKAKSKRKPVEAADRLQTTDAKEVMGRTLAITEKDVIFRPSFANDGLKYDRAVVRVLRLQK
jgi:hypothetical protein